MDGNEIDALIARQEERLSKYFKEIDEVSLFNTKKVLSAFRAEGIALRHFDATTGYGYGDCGREALGRVYARAFGAERAVASPLLASGTHTLSVALFGVLRPGDKVLFLTGEPYDTLRGVVCGSGNGSLRDFGISSVYLPLLEGGKCDFDAAESILKLEKVRMVYIQRSRGYELRDAFTVDEIQKMCAFVRGCGFTGCIMVDNCYGEFVERAEPTEVGADLVAGSLIKNPGGGLAPTGGYLAGKKEYIEMCENRLTAPSVGGEIGSYAAGYRSFFQGFYLAPHVVGQALKGSLLIGGCMEALGFENFPPIGGPLADITRAIRFDSEAQLVSFIRSVQAVSPVDSFAVPEAWDMPGYDCKVIMAAGTFVAGASVELSADAPIRRPYTAYFQGGLCYEHCKIACKEILKNLFSSSK